MVHNHWFVGFRLQSVTCTAYAWSQRDGDHSWPLRHRGRLACTRSLERRTAGCVLFVTCYLLHVS